MNGRGEAVSAAVDRFYELIRDINTSIPVGPTDIEKCIDAALESGGVHSADNCPNHPAAHGPVGHRENEALSRAEAAEAERDEALAELARIDIDRERVRFALSWYSRLPLLGRHARDTPT